MKLNIMKVGATVEHDGEVVLVFIEGGSMPPDCVAVFMDKPSWLKIKEAQDEDTE